MKNLELREHAKNKGVKLWQVADELNVLDSNFSRLLRKELSEEKKNEIIRIIDRLAAE